MMSAIQASSSSSSSSSRKRRRDGDGHDADDGTIVGLDVRGQLFYFPLSTLLAANDGCSYFSARFRPDGLLDPGLLRVDERGRKIYGLDCDPDVFRHVAEHLESSERPQIGWYEQNKVLWRNLREAAGYFGLEGLVEKLKITFSCSPETDGMKGVLHWLGTNKGTSDYVNPLERGAVSLSDCHPKERSLFVQHRPNPEGEFLSTDYDSDAGTITSEELWTSESAEAKSLFRDVFCSVYGPLRGCGSCFEHRKDLVTLSFTDGTSVSPTHYSIRDAGCSGMGGDWDFSGSVDGHSWIVLHSSRGKPSYRDFDEKDEEVEMMRDHLKVFKGCDEREAALCDYMEQHHRHKWKLRPSVDFFTHFRITGIPVDRETDDRECDCVHGIGFELWGGVREEWGEQLSDEAPVELTS